MVFRGHDRFYGRSSTGKYPLSTDELRRAFLGPSAGIDRIRDWRIDRILNLSRNEAPISPFSEGGKLVLHCIPVSSFGDGARYEVLKYGKPGSLTPMQMPLSFFNTLNFEGAIAYDGGTPHNFYTQVYRNGTIEAVDGYILNRSNPIEADERRFLPSLAYEQNLIDYVPKCLTVIKDLGANCPILVAVSLLGIRGLRMGVGRSFDVPRPMDRDSLLVPEAWIQSFTEPADVLLKSTFDMVWNAFGYEKSPYYGPDGRFKKP